MWRGFWVVVFVLGLSSVAGCAFLDKALGVDAEGNAVAGGSPVSAVGGVLGAFFPWAGTAAGLLGTVYQTVRKAQVQVKRDQYFDAAKSVVSGLELAFGELDVNGDGKVSVDELKALLKRKQDNDGTRLTIVDLLKMVKA